MNLLSWRCKVSFLLFFFKYTDFPPELLYTFPWVVLLTETQEQPIHILKKAQWIFESLCSTCVNGDKGIKVSHLQILNSFFPFSIEKMSLMYAKSSNIFPLKSYEYLTVRGFSLPKQKKQSLGVKPMRTWDSWAGACSAFTHRMLFPPIPGELSLEMLIWVQDWGQPVACWTQRDCGGMWQLQSYPRIALSMKRHRRVYLVKLPILCEILVLLMIYWLHSKKQTVPSCAGQWLGSVEIRTSAVSAVSHRVSLPLFELL